MNEKDDTPYLDSIMNKSSTFLQGIFIENCDLFCMKGASYFTINLLESWFDFHFYCSDNHSNGAFPMDSSKIGRTKDSNCDPSYEI